MSTPQRPIGAGGWFLRAYAAGFGVVFGIGSALFVGGMFYLVLAGVGTMLMSSDGAIEIDFTGNHTANHAMEPYEPNNPLYVPGVPLQAESVPSAYYSDSVPPAQSEPVAPATNFDPYQAPSAPERVAPPTYAQPATSSPYPEVPVGSFVPVESPVEASATFEEPSQPIFDEPEATPFLDGESSDSDAGEDSVTDDNDEESDSTDTSSQDKDSSLETSALPAA